MLIMRYILAKLFPAALVAIFLLVMFSGSGLLAAGDENWDANFGFPGMNTTVNALVIAPNGYLYAGGNFTSAGGESVNYIARWDGTNWTDLNGGMNNTVRALAIDSDGNLYAGGVSANRVAIWDGSNWYPLSSGLNNPVSALTIDENDQLYVGRKLVASWKRHERFRTCPIT